MLEMPGSNLHLILISHSFECALWEISVIAEVAGFLQDV